MPGDVLVVEALRLIDENHGLQGAIAKVRDNSTHIFVLNCGGDPRMAVAVLEFCVEQQIVARQIRDNWARTTPEIEDSE